MWGVCVCLVGVGLERESQNNYINRPKKDIYSSPFQFNSSWIIDIGGHLLISIKPFTKGIPCLEQAQPWVHAYSLASIYLCPPPTPPFFPFAGSPWARSVVALFEHFLCVSGSTETGDATVTQIDAVPALRSVTQEESRWQAKPHCQTMRGTCRMLCTVCNGS